MVLLKHIERSGALCLPVGYDDISDCIDLIICLGGDGTLLYASSLFQVTALLLVEKVNYIVSQYLFC